MHFIKDSIQLKVKYNEANFSSAPFIFRRRLHLLSSESTTKYTAYDIFITEMCCLWDEENIFTTPCLCIIEDQLILLAVPNVKPE